MGVSFLNHFLRHKLRTCISILVLLPVIFPWAAIAQASSAPGTDMARSIHVIVALCDNRY